MTVPRYAAHEFAELLLAAARHLLAERERRLPAAVEAGTITAAEAAHRQELARCLVAQWEWLADPASPLLPAPGPATGTPFGAADWDLAPDLRDAATRARTLADRGKPQRAGEVDARQIADLYEALAFLQHPPHGHGTSIVPRVAHTRALAAAARPQRLAA